MLCKTDNEDNKMIKIMIRTLVVASTMLLLAANAYAADAIPGGFTHASGDRTIQTVLVDSKEKAYSLGYQELQKLVKLHSGKALSDELRLHLGSTKERNSVTLEDANVTVQEYMNAKGDIVYRGKVNVIYHYSSEIDSN